MERYKKIGKSSFAKHLRKKTGKWTKSMANSKSRLRLKKDLSRDVRHVVAGKLSTWKDFKKVRKTETDPFNLLSNKFDETQWNW